MGLGYPCGEILTSMYDSEPQLGLDGALHPIDKTTRISVEEGLTLYQICSDIGAMSTLEIGLGYGFSTTFIMAALMGREKWSHTAIDPYQHQDWKGIGLVNASKIIEVSKFRSQDSFQHINEYSDVALCKLRASEKRYDLIFIDGYHRFDDVLVDFYLASQICAKNGFIVFHDLWLDSVKAVVSFIRSNRADYTECTTACDNICVFKKTGFDKRDWMHFVGFSADQSSSPPQDPSLHQPEY